MRLSVTCAVILLLLAGLVAGVQPTWGQEVTASITGTVLDPSGAPIKGAQITAKDVDRGTMWTTQTNDAGVFNVLRVPVGKYSVTAVATGFETATYPPFVLVLNQVANLNFQMRVGKVSESVEVSGEAPILQTQSTEVSTLIDANTAVSLPLSSRNYLQLTLLVPGATNPNPQTLYQNQNMTGAGRPQINGNREQSNAVLLDGLVNSEDTNNEVGYQPAPDALEEFNVITQNASAEFGNYQGGVISATIKSGTNNFHGDVYEFFRNDVLNANTWSAGLAIGGPSTPGTSQPNGVLDKPKLRWNEFGGSFGGPIVKNKLFFFADFEGGRFDKPSSPQSYQLFTPAEVAGNFAQLCTDNGGSFTAGICHGGTGVQLVNPTTKGAIPNNNLAAAGLTINPVAAGLFALPAYTAAQSKMVNVTNANNYFAPGYQNLNNDQGDLKIDYNATNADHVFFRYTQAHITNPSVNVFTLGNPGLAIDEPMNNIVANWDHSFTPNMLNEARFGISRVKYDQTSRVGGLGDLAQQIGIAGGNEFAPGLPQINIGSITYGSNDLLQNFGTGAGQLADNLVITHGRQTIKTGFQYIRERQNYSYPGNNGILGTFNISSVSGSPQADFWLGLVGGGGRDAGAAEFGARGNIFGAFVQDDWRVTNTLTLNLGLRFEDHTPFYEIQNREVNFGLYSGALEVAQGHNALYANYLGIGDWLPRIGFAWSPAASNGKTVIRGGYGISAYMEGGGANQRLTGDWPFTQDSSLTEPSINLGFLPAPPKCASPLTLTCFHKANIKVFAPNLRPARTQQWNLTLQHQFNNSTSGQIGYVGQHGTNLYNFETLQQKELLLPSGAIAKPGEVGTVGPDLYIGNNIVDSGYIGGTTSNSDSFYSALQAVLKKTMSQGLEGQVAYTYSRCLTNSPGFFGTGTWGGTNGSQTSMGLPGWQNIYDPRSDWGPCYYDETHILSNYVTYQLPVGQGKKFGNSMNKVANAIVGNWEVGGIVTWHTGNAVTPTIGFSDPSGTSGGGGLFADERPDCTAPPTYLKTLQGAPGAYFVQWWNTSTFTVPAANTFGTCSSGVLRGPRYSETDLSLHKDFLITETKRLEFRSEFINLFNHPIMNFTGGIGSFQLGSSTFGQINASQLERQIQLALKFYF
ncbi:MAG TPA: carboxypeptidase regulatory-like domain-containing protein [Terriglobales bacterium]|nr:carboxypeptidase regulatory-like domain-containing protein [Terriglobales bacterium]